MSTFDLGDMHYIDHSPRPTPENLRFKGMKVAVFRSDKKFMGTGEYIGDELYFCPTHGPGTYPCIHLDAEHGGEIVYGCDYNYVPLDKLPPPVQNEIKKKSDLGGKRF